jgi:hypothetical protein
VTSQGSRDRDELNRELIELLNELRVALPGVQVLFAFLLIVPFSKGWAQVTSLQRDVYFAAFLCTAVASALLMAPTAMHRLRWRGGDKEYLLETANRLAIGGTVFLAAGMAGVVLLIADVLFGTAWAAVVAALVAGLLVVLWYGLPLARRLQQSR